MENMFGILPYGRNDKNRAMCEIYMAEIYLSGCSLDRNLV